MHCICLSLFCIFVVFTTFSFSIFLFSTSFPPFSTKLTFHLLLDWIFWECFYCNLPLASLPSWMLSESRPIPSDFLHQPLSSPLGDHSSTYPFCVLPGHPLLCWPQQREGIAWAQHVLFAWELPQRLSCLQALGPARWAHVTGWHCRRQGGHRDQCQMTVKWPRLWGHLCWLHPEKGVHSIPGKAPCFGQCKLCMPTCAQKANHKHLQANIWQSAAWLGLNMYFFSFFDSVFFWEGVIGVDIWGKVCKDRFFIPAMPVHAAGSDYLFPTEIWFDEELEAEGGRK